MSDKSKLYALGKPDADVSAAVAETMATIKAFVALVESIRVDATVDEARQIRELACAVEYDVKVLRRVIDDALYEVTNLTNPN
jgi:hypothetical protein